MVGKRGKIHTVLGELEISKLGFTQCHEHLMLSKGKSYEISSVLCMDEPEKSKQEAEAYMAAGGCSLVDAQPGGCNRDSGGLVKISRETGLHVIASTGFHKLQFYPEVHWIRSMEKEKLAAHYISELTEGMCTGTDKDWIPRRQESKAGIIKTALDSCSLEGRYLDLFWAAAKAQTETDAPMMVHIEKGSSIEQLLYFLKEQHVDYEKVYFCHMDRACEKAESFWRVLDAGAALEFDTIGRFKYHSDEKELELMGQILERGYEKQLLFSLDTTRARLKAYDPSAVGLTYILEIFLPKMRKNGITEEQIFKIAVENPGRILAW